MLDSLKQKKNFQRIKMRIKTGDLVKVINGKEKGKTGEVLKTIPLENRVVVKGINLRTKHVKPTQEGETGRILTCLLYTSPSPRDFQVSRMPSSA